MCFLIANKYKKRHPSMGAKAEPKALSYQQIVKKQPLFLSIGAIAI